MDEKKQSNRGIPQYRCQRCGDVNMNTEAPCVPYEVLATLANNPLAIAAGGVPRSCVHTCDDNGAGLSVIIGMFPEHHLEGLRKNLKAEKEAAEKHRGILSKSVN